MKKRIGALLLAAAMVCTGVPVHAEEATDVVIADAFPDYDMQMCVADSFDKNADGVLDAEEIANATELVVDSWSYWVYDVTGIEYLTELRKLDAEFSMIEEIDVSKNTKLEELNISLTYVEDIDLSNCPELKVFDAQETYLTSVDFSKNTKLEEINLIACDITELNLDNLTELKVIKADKMPMASLDVSDCTKLENVTLIGAKNLAALDLSNNTALKSLDISGTAITELSLDNNTALEELKSYDRSDVYWMTFKAAPIKGLDVSNNTALKTLYLDGTDLSHIEELDLTNYPSLTKVSLENAGIKEVKFNDAVTYSSIYLTGNKLVSADYPASVAENAKVEFGSQTRTVKVPSADTLETFDLNTLVDVSRVTVVDSDAIDYDVETGIVTFTGESKEFSYKYMVDADRVMDVTITVEKKTVEEEAAEKEAADKAAAQPVVEMINAIGTVTLDSEEAIAAAREAYDALTDDQKQYVDNYDVLTAAEEELEELKEEAEAPEDSFGGSEEPDGEDDTKVPEGGEDSETPDDSFGGSEEDKDAEGSDASIPKTGDTTSILPYILAMAAALVVILKRKSFR